MRRFMVSVMVLLAAAAMTLLPTTSASATPSPRSSCVASFTTGPFGPPGDRGDPTPGQLVSLVAHFQHGGFESCVKQFFSAVG